MDKMRKVTGLWAKKSSHGKNYMTAPLDKREMEDAMRSVGKGRLMIFKNTYKRKEEQPDYILYVTEEIPHNNHSKNGGDQRRNAQDDWDRNNGNNGGSSYDRGNSYDNRRDGSPFDERSYDRGPSSNSENYDQDDDFFR